MAIDFPGSPQLNEEFTSAGVTWKWDGQKWVSQSPGGGGGTGMPTGGGTPPEDAFYENTMVINDDYQITDGKNAGTFGPVTVNSTVTVPDGQTWTVVGGGEGGGGGGGGVTSIIAGEGISVDQPTGAVTITNTGGGGGPTTPGARYQSGTWTPAFCEPVSGNPGTSVTDVWPNTLATWVRVGNQVTISGYIRLTNVGDLTGSCALGGVPYPADDGYYGASRVFWQSLGEATVNAGLTITGHAPDAVNPSAMLLWQLPAASQNMSQAQYGTGVGSGSNFIFTITYFTDDTSFSPAETSDVNEDTQGIGGGGATGVRYQEGTWTPTSPIGTLTLQPERNYWSRIGNTVTLNGCIVGFSDNTSADLIRIQSIPYICEGGVAGVCYAGNIATSAGQINTCYTGDNSNEVQFSSSSNIKGNAQQVAKYSDINSTSGPFVWFTITYQTNNTTFDPGPGAVATVDIQGGGGSGGGSGSGADAWGNVNADGTKNGGGLNFADVNKVSEGVYEITFTTPMPNDQYSVTASVSPAGSGNQPVRMITAGEQTTAGFKVITTNGGSIVDGTNAIVKDYPFTFAVFASNAIAPQAGVGADCWGRVSDTATLLGSGFNIGSVERVPGQSTGAYRITFATPMPTEEYSVVMTPVNSQCFGGASSQTKASFDIYIRSSGAADALTNSEFSFTVHASSTVTPTYTWTRDGTTVCPANTGDTVTFKRPTDDQAGLVGLGYNADLFANFEPSEPNNQFGIWNESGLGKVYVGLPTSGLFNIVDTDDSNTDKYIKMGLTSSLAGISLGAKAGVGSGNNAINFYIGGTKVGSIKYNGSTAFNLEWDDPAHWTQPLEEGAEPVYNGPTLNSLDVLLELKAKIETLEAAKASLEARLSTLEGGN